MNESDYAQSIGVLREMEKALISREQWQRAIDAPDVSEALRVMGGDYDFSSMRGPEAYEPVLQAKLKETYDKLYILCVQPEVVDILNLKYVFHNLKVLVKASVSEYARQNSDAILSSVSAVKPSEVSEKGGAPGYVMEAKRVMEEAFAVNRDPQAIDVAADRLMFARMLELAEGLKNEYILRYVQMSIDLYNLTLLVRVRNMQKGPRFLQESLLDGGLTDKALMADAYDKPFDAIVVKSYYKYFGDAVRLAMEAFEKTKNFSELEKLTDNLLTTHIARAKFIAFGPEPLFAFIIARENEIRQIRIIITCKLNSIPEDTLRERLRDI